MRHIIEKLRDKPEHQRHMIRLGVSVGVTGILAIAWLGYMINGFGGGAQVQATVKEATPFSAIGNNVSESFSSIGNKWSDLIGEVKENMEARKSQVLNNQQ